MSIREALALVEGIEARQNIVRQAIGLCPDLQGELGMVLEYLKQYAQMVNKAIDKVQISL